MEFYKVKEYLILLDQESLEQFEEVFNKFYNDLEFYGNDSGIYNFPNEYKKILRALQEFNIITITYDDEEDDYYYSIDCTQLDMAKIKNEIDILMF